MPIIFNIAFANSTIPASSTTNGGLKVELSLNKKEYKPGEDIEMTIGFSNQSDGGLFIYLDRIYELTKFELSEASEKGRTARTEFDVMYDVVAVKENYHFLAKGEKYTWKVKASYNHLQSEKEKRDELILKGSDSSLHFDLSLSQTQTQTQTHPNKFTLKFKYKGWGGLEPDGKERGKIYLAQAGSPLVPVILQSK